MGIQNAKNQEGKMSNRHANKSKQSTSYSDKKGAGRREREAAIYLGCQERLMIRRY